LTDAAIMIAQHDAGPWESDPEFFEILMEERQKVSVMLDKKAQELKKGRELTDFDCD
jgi:hypothetical protein